ncbi:MAG: class I SAM-dependent methyltransferase [Candidatus Vecturithrix sp.]|nr:class I SAM-dependent methyltransferase [Candidatus Vecturithrix sp.]
MKTPSAIINRPGGFIITDRAISFCGFQKGAKLLDLGCGSGATVDYLRDNHGFEAYGIDTHPKPSRVQHYLINASAETLPLPAVCLDGVLMECSFSLMDDQERVLQECFRVLQPGGRLIVSTLYARRESAKLNSCLKRIDTKDDLVVLIEHNGFLIELFEDYTHDLKTMWGQMIFEQGTHAFYCDLGVAPETMKRIQCGYCLMIAAKKNERHAVLSRPG